MKKCDRCGREKDIEGHHVHCRFMNNKQGKGKVIDLCKDRCHLPLHIIISSILWKYIKKEDEEKVIRDVENFTENYINNYHKKEKEFSKQQYLSNLDIDKGIKKCIFCGAELDIEDEYCDFCDAPQYKINNEYED
jgi:hypothetical protein